MHYCGFRYEGVPRSLDFAHQIYQPTSSHRLWSLRGQRRSQRSLCCMHRQRHLAILRKVQAQCFEDSGDPERLCRRWRRSRLWKPDRWCALLVGGKWVLQWHRCPADGRLNIGNVKLLPPKDNVEKLLLRTSRDGCPRGHEPVPHRTARHVSGQV